MKRRREMQQSRLGPYDRTQLLALVDAVSGSQEREQREARMSLSGVEHGYRYTKIVTLVDTENRRRYAECPEQTAITQ